LFIAVPRVWEKFEEKLKEAAAKAPSLMKSISAWAKGHGYDRVMRASKDDIEQTYCYQLANFLILKRIKKAIGLDECGIFFYGAAPLKKSTIDYFGSLDIPLFNMYGLSETTGSIVFHRSSGFRLDCAGEAMSGTHIKIVNPDENEIGEVCISGRNVMMGYFKNEEATKECIAKDGYIKTGDLGRL